MPVSLQGNVRHRADPADKAELYCWKTEEAPQSAPWKCHLLCPISLSPPITESCLRRLPGQGCCVCRRKLWACRFRNDSSWQNRQIMVVDQSCLHDSHLISLYFTCLPPPLLFSLIRQLEISFGKCCLCPVPPLDNGPWAAVPKASGAAIARRRRADDCNR